jgi:ribonuclease HI
MTVLPPTITIYTDGACLGNPGPGGYGVVLLDGQQRQELAVGYRLTTNNRMEMMAAIAGLEALAVPSSVTLYSDSQYLVDAVMKGWAKRWRANGWKRNAKDKAKNPDLWAKILGLCEQHQVTFIWVRGHAGNVENERCDRLAVAAANGRDRLLDQGFESSQA